MKTAAVILFGFVACNVWADAPRRWDESFQIFATVAKVDDTTIIAEADAALTPLGFHRDSTGTTYPGNFVPGIFASYKAGNLAAAMIVEASRAGCIVFSVTNYDKAAAGFAGRAGAAIRARFRGSFATGVSFFSDPECTHAL